VEQEDVQAVIQSCVKQPLRDERKQRPFRRRDDLRAEALALKPDQQPRLIFRGERGHIPQN